MPRAVRDGTPAACAALFYAWEERRAARAGILTQRARAEAEGQRRKNLRAATATVKSKKCIASDVISRFRGAQR